MCPTGLTVCIASPMPAFIDSSQETFGSPCPDETNVLVRVRVPSPVSTSANGGRSGWRPFAEQPCRRSGGIADTSPPDCNSVQKHEGGRPYGLPPSGCYALALFRLKG